MLDTLKVLFSIYPRLVFIYSRYQQNFPQQWFELMASFERHKKKADPDKRNDIKVDIPFEFDRHFAQLTNRDLAEVLHEKEKRYDVVYLPDAGKLLLKWSAVKRLFDPVIEQLKDEILKVRNNIPFRRLQYMLLVGGFAESKYLQREMRRSFERRLTIIVPEEAQLAIIKGAVYFGHEPETVLSRISRCSYGISTGAEFIEGVHREDMALFLDGVKHTEGLFCPIKMRGDRIDAGDLTQIDVHPLEKDQTFIQTELYILPCLPDQPQYVDDPLIKKLGVSVQVNIPTATERPRGGRHVVLTIFFGETELRVEAFNKATGDKMDAKFNLI